MLRKFSGLALFVFFSVMLALLLLFNLLIETHIAVVTHVSLITCLGFLLDIEINFQISSGESFELSSIHLDQSCFSRDMFFEKHISESFRLVSLPIFADSDLGNFAEGAEPISDVIFFQTVGQVFDINGLCPSLNPPNGFKLFKPFDRFKYLYGFDPAGCDIVAMGATGFLWKVGA